jgi:hypothetical protein
MIIFSPILPVLLNATDLLVQAQFDCLKPGRDYSVKSNTKSDTSHVRAPFESCVS